MNTERPSSQQSLGGEDWAGEMGDRWLTNLDRLEGMIEPIGSALIERAEYGPGERVLDIGSGGGATTRAIAALVAPDGEAVGVDIAPMLVAEAERRSAAQAVSNSRFVCADAGAAKLDDAPFDRLFSRFGSMFFEDPAPSFANLHAMLRGGARMDLAVWGPPRENLWMMELMSIVRNHVDVPAAEPRAPGPFAFEDVDYLSEILNAGGFSDIDVCGYEGQIALGGPGATATEAVQFVLSSMGIGRILAEQNGDIRDRASADLLTIFERHHISGAGVMMGCKVWFVTAKA